MEGHFFSRANSGAVMVERMLVAVHRLERQRVTRTERLPIDCSEAWRPEVERATIVRGSISRAEIIVAVPVEFMYTVNVVHGHAWTHSIIWQSSVAKALQGPLQNFDHISVFLPASDSARAQGVAIGLASCEFKRFQWPIPSRSMASCSKCSIAGMLTTLRGIWRCIGSRPNCWL